jgi:hypothetical protein
MDQPLGVTLRELFTFLEFSTVYLKSEKTEEVFQSLSYELEKTSIVSQKLLCDTMKEFEYTKRTYSVEVDKPAEIDHSKRDNPLNLSIRNLFSLLKLATNGLTPIETEQVFQSFSSEMVGKASEELLCEVMKEFGYTKQNTCLECNELIEDQGHTLCGRCEMENDSVYT